MKIGTDFSGIGAPEMALINLQVDFEQVFTCEIDKYARQSYLAMHQAPGKFYNDITERDHKEVEQLDLYVAGFPCQAFSIAGQRKGFDDVRGTILENVKGLLSHDNGRTYQTITDILTNGGGTLNGQMSLDVFEDGLGYHCYTQVLNTKDFGIPQNRERIFIIGFKDFRGFSFPKAEPLELRLKDLLQDNPNAKYYLSDKALEYLRRAKEDRDNENVNIDNGSGTSSTITRNYHKGVHNRGETYIKLDEKYYLSDKMIEGFRQHNINHKNKGTGFIWQPKDGDGVANALRANAALCPTDNSIKVGYINQDTQSSQVFSEDNCSPTINAGTHGYNLDYVKSERIRRLTPLECWRLQAFPDDAFFKAQAVCSDTQLYKQAGNSISVNVLERILNKML